MNRIYLDHNATTAVDPAVLDAMLPSFSADFGNASSIHTFGQRARAAVETARERVAALLNARPQEIVFTSGGTESDNHAIFGVALEFLTSLNSSTSLTFPHIITTTIEHEAVLNACQALEKQGVAVTYLPVNRQGLIDLDELRRALRPETVLITVMHANNELGTIQPLADIPRVPDCHVNSANLPPTPNTTHILFPGLEGDALLIAPDLKGPACSTGAACSSGAIEPSHLLTAIGLPASEARASIRFSLGRHTTESEISSALEIIPAAVAQLRKLSPTYQKSVAIS